MQLKWKREWTRPVLGGVGSFLVGAGLGYILGQRKSKYDIIELIDEKAELESVQLELDFKRVELDKQFNHMIQEAAHVVREFKQEGQSFLEQRAAEMHRSMANHPTSQPTEERSDGIDYIIPETIFKDNSDGEWNYEDEIPGRSKDFPYIIHHDEYYNNEMDCSHTTLTYYQGDDILCDEEDVPIYEYLKLTGLLKFGHGSHDPNVVYIRNEANEAEYEVLREEGYFQVEILGTRLGDDLSKDVKHSIRKFRME
jgi:uncharacterized membrane-anchored protein YhcB (DUF1043 family)